MFILQTIHNCSLKSARSRESVVCEHLHIGAASLKSNHLTRMSKVTIGNTTVAPEDIVSIAAHGAPVELDLAIIEKVRRTRLAQMSNFRTILFRLQAPEGGKTIEIATCEVTTKSLPAIEARAVLAAFLVALSQVRWPV